MSSVSQLFIRFCDGTMYDLGARAASGDTEFSKQLREDLAAVRRGAPPTVARAPVDLKLVDIALDPTDAATVRAWLCFRSKEHNVKHVGLFDLGRSTQLLLLELFSLADGVLHAWDTLQSLLASGLEPPERRVACWNSIHTLLVLAAGISRLLKPSDPRGRPQRPEDPSQLEEYEEQLEDWKSNRKSWRARATKLRECVDGAHMHVLLRRTLRDHIEHMEDRLHSFLDGEPRSSEHRSIGPVVGGQFPADQRFQNFDPTEMRVSFQGDVLDLRELVEQVRHVVAHGRGYGFSLKW